MKPIRSFTVTPVLPPPIERLRELVSNLRWSWDHEAIALFRRLDPELWEASGHNPVRMLGTISQARLQAVARDEGFRTHLARVLQAHDNYMAAGSTWFGRRHPGEKGQVAYFSAEFGLTECLSIFAGGLGILAGDHLKSASDLAIPLVGIGLLYQQGYFRQYLNEAGWQQQVYEDNDFYNLPLEIVRGPDAAPLRIPIPELGRPAWAQVWRAQVGRVPLYLLDTNISDNQTEERDVTDQLYGGDQEMRIRQEILLGLGGYRTLEALGLEPCVYHMNEGHSAFLALERIGRLMARHGLSFAEAREVASAGLVFTTHTPLPAGHDRFAPALVERYLGAYARGLGLGMQELLALGRQNPADVGELFCMTVMALRLAAQSNAVSRLHGRTTRRMWSALWPGLPTEEIPIRQVTNGVHFRSWISKEMNELYDRYMGPRWREEAANRQTWLDAARIPAEELWRTHERRRERLVAFARRRLHVQLERRAAPRHEISVADSVLNSEALTIGFARRFVDYKRATLLLHDVERLKRIVNDPARPVQVVFAGKAHPHDDAGKELIQRIVQLARQPEFRRRIVFLEDADMALARALVQGCDVWLNTPRRPNEACGTSGMKAAANAVLNLSTLDGWWDEAWNARKPDAPPFGWAIGRDEVYSDPQEQDQVEADALYGLLERDVVPIFYERDADGLPRRWIARMQATLGALCHEYSSHRMVSEYTVRFYLPAARRCRGLEAEGFASARQMAVWRARIANEWPRVRVESVVADLPRELQSGEEIVVRAHICLGSLSPKDVVVELYHGRVDAQDEIFAADTAPMRPLSAEPQEVYEFESAPVKCEDSGRYGFTVRVLPEYHGMPTHFLPGYIVWADASPGR